MFRRLNRLFAEGILATAIIVGMTNAPLSRAQSVDESATFEVASVKPGSPGFTGAPGTPNGDGAAAFPACAGGLVQVDPQRFSATNTTRYAHVRINGRSRRCETSGGTRGSSEKTGPGYRAG